MHPTMAANYPLVSLRLTQIFYGSPCQHSTLTKKSALPTPRYQHSCRKRAKQRAQSCLIYAITKADPRNGRSTWRHKFGVRQQCRHAKKLANAKVQIWWRATDENEKHITDLIALGKKENNTALINFARTAATGFATARAERQPFHATKNNPPDGRTMDATSTDFHQPVYVIVPGQCGSACLDAIDVFNLCDNTKLIGAPSSADSTYMEVHTAPLPSKMAHVILPLKIWVNRPGGNGVFYKPAIEVTDVDWSSSAFMQVIKQDLLTQRKSAVKALFSAIFSLNNGYRSAFGPCFSNISVKRLELIGLDK